MAGAACAKSRELGYGFSKKEDSPTITSSVLTTVTRLPITGMNRDFTGSSLAMVQPSHSDGELLVFFCVNATAVISYKKHVSTKQFSSEGATTLQP
ncbi:hypothetical protein I308_106384 [Cryptococcus tetragattii IND107]|uniref:Uncharacterized protein n=1 Tax=Cryptococcus tetragattii IND107 TaxID=1296105 RepID=A0ABR3BLF0_9TREE